MNIDLEKQQQIKDLENAVNNWRESWTYTDQTIRRQRELMKECLEYLETHNCMGSAGLIKKLVEALE